MNKKIKNRKKKSICCKINRSCFMIIDINKNYFRPILEEHGLTDERGEDDGL